jgi:predicted TIM-barrel fold metal-dependent hydrolase
MASRVSCGAIAAMTGPRIVCADTARMPIIDTHVHCFAGRTDPRFPYHVQGPYQPEQASTPERLLGCMREAGVDYAVIVHPEPYQDDHRYLEHCLQVGQGRLKGTCLFFAGRADSTRRLAELVKSHPQAIVALRIHAYAPERLPPFGKPELRELWKAAANLGLIIQLHFDPRYASGFEPLIREFASTRVIVDHLGRPMQGTPDEYAVVVRWSRFPNTVMKLPDQPMTPHRYASSTTIPKVSLLIAARSRSDTACRTSPAAGDCCRGDSTSVPTWSSGSCLRPQTRRTATAGRTRVPQRRLRPATVPARLKRRGR